MAKTKRKKQSIVQRMMFGNENKPDLTPEKANMGKWAMFKFLFGHRIGTMAALNLLSVIFAIPAIFVILMFEMNIAGNNTYIPYSANLGVGYTVVVDAALRGDIAEFMFTFYEYLLLVPCIAVFAVGLSGNFYVMRKLIWQEPTSTGKDFFRGIKKCWLPSLFMGLAFGFTLLLFVFSLRYFDVFDMPLSIKVVSIITSSVLLVFISLFTAFFMTQNAAFKMRPIVLLRNSALFVLATNVQAILFVGIAVAPALLVLVPVLAPFIACLYVLIGFSFATLVMSLFCHYCYEKFLYDKIDKPSSMYAKRKTEIEEMRAASQQKKKNGSTSYKNPKKRKKSIDEGATITPLTPTFRREDLERLEKEHAEVLKENDESDADELDELGDLEEFNDGAADLSDTDTEKLATESTDTSEENARSNEEKPSDGEDADKKERE